MCRIFQGMNSCLDPYMNVNQGRKCQKIFCKCPELKSLQKLSVRIFQSIIPKMSELMNCSVYRSSMYQLFNHQVRNDEDFSKSECIENFYQCVELEVQLVNVIFKRSIDQLIYQSINCSVNQSINQSINQSFILSFSQSMNE